MSSSQLAFSTIPMSLVRTFSMMLGEMDFVGTYVEPFWYHELPLPISSFILLCKMFYVRSCNKLLIISFVLRSLHDIDADFADELTDWFGSW